VAVVLQVLVVSPPRLLVVQREQQFAYTTQQKWVHPLQFLLVLVALVEMLLQVGLVIRAAIVLLLVLEPEALLLPQVAAVLLVMLRALLVVVLAMPVVVLISDWKAELDKVRQVVLQ
jgi:hypothetical protein